MTTPKLKEAIDTLRELLEDPKILHRTLTIDHVESIIRLKNLAEFFALAMKPETGGAAFPGKVDSCNDIPEHFVSGMTLRDYFAGQALMGIGADRDMVWLIHPEECAKRAFIVADAMLRESMKEKE